MYLSSKNQDLPTSILNLATNVQNYHINLNCCFKFQKYVVKPRGGVLNKFLYGDAPPQGPNPYPFMYHF